MENEIIKKEVHRITSKQVRERKRILDSLVEDASADIDTYHDTLYIDTETGKHGTKATCELSISTLESYKDEVQARQYLAATAANNSIKSVRSLKGKPPINLRQRV